MLFFIPTLLGGARRRVLRPSAPPGLWAAVLLALLVGAPRARAQDAAGAASLPDWFWWAAQWNLIGQGHGAFPAQYSGSNSLRNVSEFDVSSVETFYSGFRVAPDFDLLLDVESAGGKGISSALGLAGYTNLDVVRSPDLGPTPYVARALLHWTWNLSPAREDAAPSYLSLARRQAPRRLEFYAGKFSLADFFDTNAVGSDSHLQFLNWAVDNDAAYDYAADTRGYTLGAYAEYDDGPWQTRFAEALMPKVANGLSLDWELSRARSENFELDRNYGRQHGGTVRLLAYLNHARMGSYGEALAQWRAGLVSKPDITKTRAPGRHKYGFGMNWEQRLPAALRLFARAGWNDGHNESFVYTEAEDTAEAGGDWAGVQWRRPQDKLGWAWVSNGLGALHRAYLAAGGLGFLLGDGALDYGREDILEAYYTVHLWRGLYAAADFQDIHNPGYNRARGPVAVWATRMHVDF
ncbi:MAG TPA: carbohydrate porin [Terriglobales bacterium]|nr:carbohydrate porin [Terriglobales bacterium]